MKMTEIGTTNIVNRWLQITDTRDSSILQPFLIDVAECDAPGLIDGIHQPDIFLE